MDFTLDSEQLALRDAVRGLLGKAYGSIDARRDATASDPGFDEKTWSRLADMGVLALPFAEEDGGVGAGPAEVMVVAEEVGRVLAPEPFVEAVVLAGGLVAAQGTAEQRAELIGGLAAGESLLALAHLEPGRHWSAGAPDVTATRSGDGWTLDGVKEPVLHGARADVLLVTAAVEGRTALFVVRADAGGLERTGYRTFDGSRAAHVRFISTPAEPLGEPGADATAALEAALAAARVAYAHESVGAMATALETTSEYLRTRKQFGVPLKTFQALTFRAADMYVSLELARSAAAWATLVLADEPERAPEAARRAAFQVSKAGRHVGQEAIQLHGGIGMTAEYSVGHYTARLTAIDHLLGDGSDHLRHLAASVSDHGVVEPMP
ncbi:acyl-CoA dehydrogenase family protein [Aeromicrobium sp. IC_218]|uniref:acyl-CoA dehydrogenase family protein n=1 Tax=Aeromicrobium sp. IC_218 TaxID=2545468 RepID=UPI001039F44A|nr:acyl-CoA dehydrogenase family protein [Aeromicrobium sp. IC_218]TCI95638.1 acyl-CoA dehydrogenase [Aeromicrobium sp. IC_218]